MVYYPPWQTPPYVDPNMYPTYRGNGPGAGFGGPRDFGPPPYNPLGGGRSASPLDPSDFSPSSTRSDNDSPDRFVEQLMICSRGLKQAGKRLANAEGEKEKRQAAADGLTSVSYLLGVLSSEGISMPIGVFGEPAIDENLSRGKSCEEAGDWVDRMVKKYSGGSRGVGRDIGEGIDKTGGCIREVRDNLGL